MRGELGTGGMGRVVLAWDRLLHREVAVKEVPAGASAAAVSRFLAEARLTARLQHPSIIPVHDAGEDENGTLFYVMKRVEGESMEQALAACGSLRERLVLLDRLIDVVHAVAHAHARGVLHRDLKPANIMLGPRGETLLLDWGIAVPLDDARPGLAGTPGFMSPEQCREEPLDARSDVWSLGAILYQVLTGGYPAEGPDPWSVMGRVAREPIPPVRSTEPGAPPPLAAIADRALAFVREDRYPTADAMAADLQAWRGGLAVSAYHYRPGEAVLLLARRHRLPLAALALGLGLAVFSAVTGFLRVRAERDVAENALASALEQQAAVADRDGDGLGALVYAASALSRGERPLARGLVVRHLGTFPYRLVERSPLAGCVQLTEHACVRLEEAVDRAGRWRVPLAEPVVAAAEGAGRLVLRSSTAVFTLDVATGAELARYAVKEAGGVWQDGTDPERMAWSEGRHVALVEHGQRTDRDVASLVKTVAWHGDRAQLAMASGEVWPDVAAGRMTCQERRGLANAEFTPDGAHLVAVTFSGALEVLDVATCEATMSGGRDVPVGGRVFRAQEGAAFVGRVADGTVRAWNDTGDEVLRLPRIPGWDTTVRATAEGFEVATPQAVLRYAPAPARFGEAPGARTATALATAPDDTWILAGNGVLGRWGWDRGLRWRSPVSSVRALAWADDRAWALSEGLVRPFRADGGEEPSIAAPLVRGILADWGQQAVFVSGVLRQGVLTRAGERAVAELGGDGFATRGHDGWLVKGAPGGWSRLGLDGALTPLDLAPDAGWACESPDGRHRGWIDAAGAPWIDGVQVAPPTERRQWIEWVAPDRWVVTSRIGTSILDDHGNELATRELEHGRVVDVAPGGDHLLVLGSDQRVEGWDLAALAAAPAQVLRDTRAALGVSLVGSELRLDVDDGP